MERRDFVTAAGLAALSTGNAELGTRNSGLEHLFPVAPSQEPSLPPEVFQHRLDRARTELRSRGLDLLVATPSTNYEYLTGYNPGRSERLIALILPVSGAPAVVCPSFEVERIKRHSVITDVRGWEEQDEPYALVRNTIHALRPATNGTIALESST